MQENNELKSTLLNLGFGEKEAIVYVSLLELGKGTVSQISRKAGINRTTGYEILDSLLNKGVVNLSGKEPKAEYAAESPESLALYFKREADKAVERVRKAEDFISVLIQHQTACILAAWFPFYYWFIYKEPVINPLLLSVVPPALLGTPPGKRKKENY